MKRIIYISIVSFFFIQCISVKQKVKATASNSDTQTTAQTSPKLVVGIIVDQMRYDYLTRFENKYSEGGFKRMIREGYNCKNNHYNYIPTYTGPGHASVYTGTTPKNHGIISNDWYDKFAKNSVYCAFDESYTSVGVTDKYEGKMSPHRMQTTTVTDQLRLATQERGKTIGIAIKDRGAILPAGHAATGAYWFYGKDKGNWITSTYYRNELPTWVKEFNVSDAAEKYLTTWNTLYDINTYTESGSDINEFEGTFKGKANANFPYDLDGLKDKNGGFDILKATAYGNSLTTDFAIAAIKGEQLGKDNTPDMLALSYSSTDYVGHRFGVNSKEIEDTYIRLDKDIERLFAKLDAEVGKGNYTIFLTADHAAVHVPTYLQSMKIPGGYFEHSVLREHLIGFLKKKYGSDKLIENTSNGQIFLDYDEVKRLNLSPTAIENALQSELLAYDQISKVYTRSTLTAGEFNTGIAAAIQKGFNQKRSGDVCYVLEPSTISYGRTGSTHGSGFNYDTHVPLVFYGNGIQQGETMRRTKITDVAPTISAILGISFPNGATGDPIQEVLED
ncbi:alkaline phosphatase PafA [uncultured Kordia sp.]|uniref:alkaline phosphatase PafA n=1 Tax=uncultured Kordia sp. TaxID=507699 RepID=UPI00262CEBEA|nr:alkaline phosphatase PafA [uncultured Kordia sp.]